MRRIFLLRHGTPFFPDGKKRCIGRTDLSLSEEGKRQALAWREQTELAGVTAIYTSPLRRCKESAALFSGGEIPVQVVEDCAEIAMGRWENRTFEEIRREDPRGYEERGRRFADFAPDGGESFRECQVRAAAAYRRILAESRGDVAIIAHAGWNRALISFLTGRDLNLLMEIPQEYGSVYEIRVPKRLGAVIVAAGLSLRMETFKPVLKISGKTFLERELDFLLRAGVSRTVIVTGRQAEELEQALAGPGVECVRNERYAETKMFDSACLGLRKFDASWDGIFFLPGDSPVFSVYTLKRLEGERRTDAEGDVFCPVYQGRPGHPLLLRGRVLPEILSHDGRMGLRGACEKLGGRKRQVAVPDPGILLDADVPEQYRDMLAYARSLQIPSRKWCEEWMDYLELPSGLKAHLEKTAQTAREMAEAVNAAGGRLDVELTERAALLHDIAKGHENHGALAAAWLRDLGCNPVAELVESHGFLPKGWKGQVDEKLIVFLADKLVRGDRPCTLEERYQSRLSEFAGNAAAEAAVRRRWEEARRAQEAYEYAAGRRKTRCDNLDVNT